MNQYIMLNDSPVLIGMDNQLCFTTYDQLYAPWKNGWVSSHAPGQDPLSFLEGNTGFIFRFPFPDENIPLGEYPEDLAGRGLPLEIDKRGIFNENDFDDIQIKVASKTQLLLGRVVYCDNPNRFSDKIDVELTGQQLVYESHRYRLCPVLRCAFSGQIFLLREDSRLQLLIGQIIHQYVAGTFWKKIIAELAKGFNVELHLPQT